MAMVFFNLIGVAMLVLALAIGAAVEYSNLIGRDYSLFVIAAGVLVIDLVYRYYYLRPKLDPRLYHWLTTYRGGSLMLLPAWVFSILGIAVMAYFELGG
jgi:hypothetical protein